MKKLFMTLSLIAMTIAAAVAVSCTGGSNGSKESLAELKEGFANPPHEARPYVWWHWMNGNITKEGIRKDLEWMNRAGIGGFHHFDAAISVPQIVENRMIYMQDDWKDAFKYAIHLGDSLGMEMSVASSPGWSCTGGPWVTPEDAMKKIVWREIYVKGGENFSGKLPEPFDVAGKMQNMTNKSTERFYKDIAVLGLRVPEEDRPLCGMDVKVTSSGGDFTLEQLSNEDLADGVLLPEGKEGYAWITYEFPEPVSFRAVSTVDGRTRNWPYLFPATLEIALEKSDDGKAFTEVVKVPSTSCRRSTVSFPEAKARFFRLRVDNTGKAGAMISEFNLYPVGRIHHAEEKAGFAAPHDIHDFPTVTDGGFVAEVVDLKDKVAEDGTLTWDVPEGNWKVLRLGYSLTGARNAPAPEEATGLEVDKLDPGAWSRYFHKYLDMYKEATGGLIGERGIQYILTDSYEAGCQNWTPDMPAAFKERRGYDITPWLPVLTGEIVGSVEESEAFLHDWKVTIADLYAENYDRINDFVKEYGMKGRYSEAHECGRVYIADGMDVKRTAAIPMAACWIDAGSASMAAADIRESASVAHIFGQNLVAAESMTAHGTAASAYKYSPRILKRTADWEMAHGVNRIIVHESAHQPVDSIFPGLGLGPYGQWFNRHETWAEQAKAWTDYLARSCYMLQRGQAVADILVYYGEDSNVCGEVSTSEMPGYIPAGYNYDYAGPTVVKMATAKKGRIVAGNMEYSLLYLDKNMSKVSVDVLKHLVALAEGGATICGHTPLAPAGMMDDAEEWKTLCEKFKGMPNVHLEKTIAETLTGMGIATDVGYPAEENILFVHRTLPGTDIYWVNLRNENGKTLELSFRQDGRTPQVWHPETGLIEDVTYRMEDGRTIVSLDLVSNDAVFVVFSGKAAARSAEVKPAEVKSSTEIAAPWNVRFQEQRGAPETAVFEKLISYPESDVPGIKYFSGRAVYTHAFNMDAVPENGSVVLDLGTVRELAVVTVNGTLCGTVWKEPYRVDITEAVKAGENALEVMVVNPWINRLIGDKQPDCPKSIGFTPMPFFKADSPLHEAGLIGPVRVETLE